MILVLFYTRKRKADHKFKKGGKWNTLERAPYSTRWEARLHISAFPRGVVWLSKVEVFELLTLLLKHDEFWNMEELNQTEY